MKKSFALVAGLLLSAFVLSATDEPRMETFLGYNYVRFNPGSHNNIVPSFNGNGGSAQFVYNIRHYVGLAVEAGAVTNGSLLGGALDTTTTHFVAGPRFSRNVHSRWMPYVEALFGGARTSSSAQISAIQVGGPIVNPLAGFPGTPISARVDITGGTHFAMLVGGGLDIKLDKHIAFRPFGFDYYLTRVPSFLNPGDNTNRNNWRYMAGVNFLFGAK
jgi:hypothetical protein